MPEDSQEVVCPYCGNKAILVTGVELYPHRRDLRHTRHYKCFSCLAWVGCHKGTEKPLGRLANADLRKWKTKAHAAFDPLWKKKMAATGCSKKEARGAGYIWLARELEIEKQDCHIGYFNVTLCKKVVSICQSVGN